MTLEQHDIPTIEARTAWQVWRRIMREPALHAALLDRECISFAELAHLNFAAEEQWAALAYAGQRDRAKWFVENYRFRLTNSFLNALEVGAPLTLRALLNQGAVIHDLAKDFLDLHEWKDYGPFVYSYCADALEFLAGHPAAANAGVNALIGLELAGVDLMLGLRQHNPPPTLPSNWMVRTGQARHFVSDTILTPWMRDKKCLGLSRLDRGTEHWLIYLPDLQQDRRFATLPPRAAQLFDALDQPRDATALANELVSRGAATRLENDDQYLATLARYGAIRIAAEDQP